VEKTHYPTLESHRTLKKLHRTLKKTHRTLKKTHRTTPKSDSTERKTNQTLAKLCRMFFYLKATQDPQGTTRVICVEAGFVQSSTLEIYLWQRYRPGEDRRGLSMICG
jgi:hypothetical protein